jgi:phospholipase A1/A2
MRLLLIEYQGQVDKMKFIITIFAMFFSVGLVSSGFADAAVTNSKSFSRQPEANYANNSVFSEREEDEKTISMNPFGLAFYKPTYVLPFYFTSSPYQQVYIGNTPNNQKIQSQEFKAQFSFKIPVWQNILGKDSKLSAAYTQQMYWQAYAKSKYFRETNYQPEIFLAKKITPNVWLNLGIEHQSNGRGGSMERSWNRAYINTTFSKNNFAVRFRPWLLIFKGSSSDLHNHDIGRYMGHGEITLLYKLYKLDLSLKTRNNFESGFRRGANEIAFSFPVSTKIKVYAQFFSGYGQSLIEYNHFTNAFGVGIALSDWI